MTGPDRLVVVCGTATEVGKTWVTARIADVLRARGHNVVARKPVQSFDPDADEQTDAEVLATATGDRPHDVCPPHRWLPVPMAPPMAVDRLGGDRFTCAELLGELRWPDTVTLGLVETVGGVRSPVADDGDSRDLVRLLDPDLVVVVADAGLGTIDAVRLATDALAPTPTAVFLNRFDEDDDLHVRNQAWLTERDGLRLTHDVAELAAWCRSPGAPA